MTPVLLAGCAGSVSSSRNPGSTSDSASRAAPPGVSAGEYLAELARREKPSAVARPELPPPDGLSAVAMGALELSRGDAGPSLPEWVARLRNGAAVTELQGRSELGTAAIADAGVDLERAKLDAASAYAAGRAKALAGETDQALELLQRATRLDPTSAELWVELAELQRTTGRRLAARRSYEEAVRRGGSSPLPFWRLAREAIKDRRDDSAAALLAEALYRINIDTPGDSSLRFIVTNDLAQALRGPGTLRASRDALGFVGDLPSEPPRTPESLQAEMAELYRRRADNLTAAGDLSLQLGETDAADRYYELAVAARPSDSAPLLRRRVYSLLTRGMDASAMQLLLTKAAESPPDDATVALVRYTGRHVAGANLLADAFEELAEASPVVGAGKIRLLRAAAAASPSPQRLLARAVELAPGDSGAVAEWLDGFGNRHTDRAVAMADAALRRPHAASALAEIWLANGVGVVDGLRYLDRSESRGAVLLSAYAHARLGREIVALERISRPAAQAPGDTSLQIAQGELAVAAANRAAAVQALDRLRASDASMLDAQLLGVCRVERALQRFADAAETGRRIVRRGAESATADDLLLISDVFMRSGAAIEAESLLRTVISRFPTDERAYAILLSLTAPAAGGASDARFAETVRLLRTNVPSSRISRVIAARDLAQRGALESAESALTELASGAPVDPGVLDLLMSVWERGGWKDEALTRRADAWTESSLRQRPESVSLMIMRARVMAATGRGGPAVDMLRSRFASWPVADLGRERERILRERLDRAEEADRLAIDRLTAAPQTIETAVELTAVLTERGRYGEAARVFDDAIPTDTQLTLQQSALVTRLLQQLPMPDARRAAQDGRDAEGEEFAAAAASEPAAPRKVATIDQPTARSVARLFDRASAGGISLPAPLVVKRVRYLAIANSTDPGTLHDLVVKLAKELNPSDGNRMIGPLLDEVVSTLMQSERPRDCLAFLRVATERTPAGGDAVVTPLLILRVWSARASAVGNADDVGELVRFADSRGMARPLLEQLATSDEVLDDAGVRGELAYQVAAGAMQLGRDGVAEDMHRVALQFDPRHVFANNDLGYSLADRGESLEEAERMILVAHQRMPDRGTIMDSLGWVRYKSGRLEDSRDAATGAAIEGAVTLLERAAKLEGSAEDPAIQDHLGDAYWYVGRKDDAVKAWTRAQRLVDATLPRIARADFATSIRNLYTGLRASLRAKLEAVERNAEPPIARPVARPVGR